MNDPTRKATSHRGDRLEDRLQSDAARIPASEQPALVAGVMRRVRATRRPVKVETSTHSARRAPWLMGGATATAALTVAIIVTMVVRNAPDPTAPGQASLPGIVESRVDPVLASPEQALAGELQRIRADLHSIGRLVSVRLESDSD